MTWTILLTLLLATGEAYYPISPPTMIVYLAGVASFSVGAFFCTHLFAQALAGPAPRVCRRPRGLILTGGLILLVAVLPLYWDHIQDLASSSASQDFWGAVRVESIAQGDDWSAKTIVTIVWEACSVLAVLLAVTAVAENKDSRFSRIRSILIIAIALLYALMAGASAGAVSVALVCFAAIATVQSKGNVDSHASLSENVSGTVELVGVYLLGGVVAFDAV